MAPLPPGVSRRDFDACMAAFREVVGGDWVFTSDEDLVAYRDPYSTSWNEPDEIRAGAAVSPTTVEQVQALVRAAGRYKVPLFPTATGKNFAYGGPAPNMSGTVVLDLKRMNKVLDVDAERYTCLVEPGVSYMDLYRHIQDRGLKVWIDHPSPGWGSPMGNALDHGIGHTMGPYRDHFGSHCGIEAVLPNGEVLRTGMGAMPNAGSWQDYRYGYGPDVAGLFGQANYGIVTKMGFWLYPQPETYRTAQVTVPRRQDLHELVKAINYLEHSFLIGEPIFNSPLKRLATTNAAIRDLVFRKGGVSDAEIDKAARDENLDPWSVDMQFYGPEPTTLANWEYAKAKIASHVPTAKFWEGENFKVPLTPEQLNNNNTGTPFRNNVQRRQSQGQPNLAVWASVIRNEANPDATKDGHIGFGPIIPRTAEAVFQCQRVFGDAYHELGVPITVGSLSTPSTWYQHAFIFLNTLPTSRSNKEMNRKSRAAMYRLIELGAENGWAEYRCPPLFQDAVMSAYSFNDHALLRFNEAMKDGVDPDGILAPGRGGIWPKRYRKARK